MDSEVDVYVHNEISILCTKKQDPCQFAGQVAVHALALSRMRCRRRIPAHMAEVQPEAGLSLGGEGHYASRLDDMFRIILVRHALSTLLWRTWNVPVAGCAMSILVPGSRISDSALEFCWILAWSLH